MSNILTTREVAAICKVSPRTVSKWFDSGRLRGYRIPGTADKRFPREYVEQFLRENNMPVEEMMVEAEPPKEFCVVVEVHFVVDAHTEHEAGCKVNSALVCAGDKHCSMCSITPVKSYEVVR